jgi:hypothetical protein
VPRQGVRHVGRGPGALLRRARRPPSPPSHRLPPATAAVIATARAIYTSHRHRHRHGQASAVKLCSVSLLSVNVRSILNNTRELITTIVATRIGVADAAVVNFFEAIGQLTCAHLRLE